MTQITVDRQTCNGCEACTIVCIAHVYGMSEKKAVAATPASCWRCGHCVAVCPVGAIRHGDYPLELCPPVETRVLPGYEELVSMFRERRSTRSFKETQVPRDTLQGLLEVGRFAPTGSNSQNVDWVVIDNASRIHDISKQTVQFLAHTSRRLMNPLVQLLFRVSKGPQYVAMLRQFAQKLAKLKTREDAGDEPIFFRAPAVAVALVPKGDGSARDNAVHALYNVELAARRIGLATCQLGFMKFALDRSRALRDCFRLPGNRSPEAVLAIGYPKVIYQRALPRRKPQIAWIG